MKIFGIHRLAIPLALFTFVALVPVGASAQEQPTAAEIDKVMDYFKDGKGKGPVLRTFTPCLKIGKAEGEKRKSCLEPAGETIARKTVLNIWTTWFVPKDDKYDDIRVIFLHEGEVRTTKDLKVSASYGYATYAAKGLYKAGNWEVQVKRGATVLKSAKFVVE